MDIAAPKPTRHRFLQLETRLEDLLLRQSILSEQESEQKADELQKRLRMKLGAGPMKGAGWEWTWVVDEKTKASVFAEDEFKAWLAPSKEKAAIDQDVDVAVAEIRGFCSQLPFHDVVFDSERHAFSEWLAEKLRQRGRSSADAGEYLNLRKQVLAPLAENEGVQEPIAEPQDRYPLFPAVRPNGPRSGYA